MPAYEICYLDEGGALTYQFTAYCDDDAYTNLVDFLADAMHWCHINCHAFQDVLNISGMHFNAEIHGDDLRNDLNQQSTERKTFP